MRIGHTFLSLFLLGIAWSRVAGATVFHEKSVTERANEADRVVMARVMASESTGHVSTGLETHSSLHVSEYLKGDGPQILDLVQTGGSSGAWQSFVLGDAQLQVGEMAVFFLRCQNESLPSTCRLLGLEAGRARIDGDAAFVFHPGLEKYSREPLAKIRSWVGSNVNGPTPIGPVISRKSLNSHRFLDFKMMATEAKPFLYFVDGRSVAPGGIPIADFQAETERAWRTWDEIACAAPAFQSQGLTTALIPEPRDPFDNHSVSSLWIQSREDHFYKTVIVGSEVTAVSLMLSYAGILQQCDIYLNAADRAFSSERVTPPGAVDLQTVILHEVGHCQGLAHSEVTAPQALDDIMYPIVPMGASKRQLSLFDQQLVCERYPAYGAFGASCYADGGCSDGLSCELAPGNEPTERVRLCTKGCDLEDASSCEKPYVCVASSAFGPAQTGACFPPAGFVTPIGKSCENSTACQTSNGECLLSSSQSNDWESGYCSQRCGASQPPCPVGSTCVSIAAQPYCLKSCRVGLADCRPGYACLPDATGILGTCQPACSESKVCSIGQCRLCDGLCLQSNRPNAAIGEPCSKSVDCGLGLVCGLFSDAGAETGVCTAPCDSACASCSDGNRCHALGPRGERFCLRSCDVGTCPTGLRCGWTPDGKGCLPPCLVDEECPVGQTCQEGECRRPGERLPVVPPEAEDGAKASGCSCDHANGGEAAILGLFGGVLWVCRKRRALEI